MLSYPIGEFTHNHEFKFLVRRLSFGTSGESLYGQTIEDVTIPHLCNEIINRFAEDETIFEIVVFYQDPANPKHSFTRTLSGGVLWTNYRSDGGVVLADVGAHDNVPTSKVNQDHSERWRLALAARRNNDIERW